MSEDEVLREEPEVLRAIENVSPSGGIPVPERQMFALERGRRDALCTASRVPTKPDLRAKTIRTVFVRRLLQAAAAIMILGGLVWHFLPRPSATNPPLEAIQVARVVITSPGDVVSTTRPRIAWTSKDTPGQRYDVWILPAKGDQRSAPTLFVAKGVTSPVEFAALKAGEGLTTAELQAGTDYRVLVCLADAGRMAGVPVPFKTAPSSK